jgi:hypothetical protein
MKLVALSYVGAAVAFAMCARYFAPHDGEAG